MKRFRKMACVLAAIMVVSSVCSCGKSENKDAAPDLAGQTAENASSGENTGGYQGDPITIKISHVFAQEHPVQKGLEYFGERLSQETNGLVTVDIYPAGVLGGEVECVEQCVAGQIDCNLVSGIVPLSGYNTIANVEELPFFFANEEEAHAAYDGEYGDLLAKELIEPIGLVFVNYWENGFRHFTNNIRPITAPEDMKGIKFRISVSEIRLQMFELLGASAISMQFNELFTALQQGTVDGQENPLSNIEASKFYEVQKYLSLCGYIYNASIMTFNPDIWASYPEEVKQAIIKCADEARDYERELNKEFCDGSVDRLKENGMEVNQVDVEVFKEAVQPVWDSFLESEGELARELVEAAYRDMGKTYGE
ncbi:MAG: DctP family TRAP transporter solute-binding subunit [Lachnospiraceae bacterium]|jgi:tripartite ATP-independent transporter DctP family solute receptor|nr:DctP family TRAP transporter solute-binding subunit [Lachnospiraceae bacterium]MCI9132854.1 DctP family TRAP transporter solute-binding subunit [Lachnospiraceae bacterium]